MTPLALAYTFFVVTVFAGAAWVARWVSGCIKRYHRIREIKARKRRSWIEQDAIDRLKLLSDKQKKSPR